VPDVWTELSTYQNPSSAVAKVTALQRDPNRRVARAVPVGVAATTGDVTDGWQSVGKQIYDVRVLTERFYSHRLIQPDTRWQNTGYVLWAVKG
jgi:hypothetical protein